MLLVLFLKDILCGRIKMKLDDFESDISKWGYIVWQKWAESLLRDFGIYLKCYDFNVIDYQYDRPVSPQDLHNFTYLLQGTLDDGGNILDFSDKLTLAHYQLDLKREREQFKNYSVSSKNFDLDEEGNCIVAENILTTRVDGNLREKQNIEYIAWSNWQQQVENWLLLRVNPRLKKDWEKIRTYHWYVLPE